MEVTEFNIAACTVMTSALIIGAIEVCDVKQSANGGGAPLVGG